jgi:Na+/glutamate symporter
MPFFVKPNSFFKLLSFRVLIVLAYQIMAIVVGWHIYELTHDTLALGLIGLAEVIPYFCCALFAGYAVDQDGRLWCCSKPVSGRRNGVAVTPCR